MGIRSAVLSISSPRYGLCFEDQSRDEVHSPAPTRPVAIPSYYLIGSLSLSLSLSKVEVVLVFGDNPLYAIRNYTNHLYVTGPHVIHIQKYLLNAIRWHIKGWA